MILSWPFHRIIAFCAGLALSAVLGGLYLGMVRHEAATLSALLQAAHVTEDIVDRGRTYTVAAGLIDPKPRSIFTERRVLAAAYAKRALRINPPFALPGADLTAFSRGIEALAAAERALRGTSEPYLDRAIASRAFFPVGALRAASAAEAARRDFLASGDRRALDAYLAAAARITPRYLRESYLFELAFRYFAPDDAEYVTERHLITKANSLSTLRTVRAGSRAQDGALRALADCAGGTVDQCDQATISYPVVDVFDTARPPIDGARYALARAYQAAADPSAADRPDVLLSDGYCQNPELPPLVGYTEGRGMPAVREAADARFLAPAAYAEVPFFQYFLDQGFAYIPSSPFSHYTCMVVPYDEGAAFAAWAVRTYAAGHTLSAEVTDNTLRSEIISFERMAAESKMFDERAARAYVRAALAARASGELSRAYEPDLLELALMIRFKTAGAGYFLEQVAASESNNAVGLREGLATRVPIERAFFTRTAFAALGMTIVPGISPRDLYESFSLPRGEMPFRYLTDLVPTVPVAELVASFQRYHALH